MVELKLKYVNRFSRGGQEVFYFRRRGVNVRLPDDPRSPEFMAEYQRCLNAHGPGKPLEKRPRHREGSVNWLISNYRESQNFRTLNSKTRKSYERMMEKVGKLGEFQAASVTPKALDALREKYFGDKPRSADELRKVCSVLWNYGRRRLGLPNNPAENLEKWHKRSSAYRRWSEDELEAARAGLQGPLLTAFMIARHTGQRRGDILALTWDKIDGNVIRLRQGKTGKQVFIPLHADLADYLASLDRGDSFMVVPGPNGKRWNPSYFSTQLRKALDGLGLPADLHFHGLDKSFMCELAESGASEYEITAVSGRSAETARYYAREYRQNEAAEIAIQKLLRARTAKKK